jgi:hypothetical protein
MAVSILPDKQVPVWQHMPSTSQHVLIVVSGAAAVASVLYAVRQSRRRRDLVHIYLVIGAGISVYYEALADTLIKAFYPEHGQITWIATFGRTIPVFIGFLYFWYLPFMSYWMLARAKHGISTKSWWTHWIAFVIGANVFEMIALTVGGNTWIYYGTQAYKTFGVPVCTPFSYTSLDIGIAAGVCSIVRFLPRRQHWLIVPAVPTLMVASQASTVFPVAVALHDGEGIWGARIASLVCVGLSLALSHALRQAFRKPWPAEVTDGAAVEVAPRRRTHRPIRVPARAAPERLPLEDAPSLETL